MLSSSWARRSAAAVVAVARTPAVGAVSWSSSQARLPSRGLHLTRRLLNSASADAVSLPEGVAGKDGDEQHQHTPSPPHPAAAAAAHHAAHHPRKMAATAAQSSPPPPPPPPPPSSSGKQAKMAMLNSQLTVSPANEKEFRLGSIFMEKMAKLKPPFGFNGLGEFVYNRTYSRVKADGTNEKWHETVERVVNGTFNMQKRWIELHELGWDARKAQRTAQEMFDRIFHMKFLPPGRGLWAMGSPLTEERHLYASLNNCAFVSTEALHDYGKNQEFSKPFTFLMDASMLGVGVGFDTKGGEPDAKGDYITIPGCSKGTKPFVIPDSREGWVESVGLLIDSFFDLNPEPQFDYSLIREAGSPIKGFGGVASGPAPLQELHGHVRRILGGSVERKVTVTTVVDLMNLIGKCVVSGNVRQTAEIAFGNPKSVEYIDLKNYEKNPHRADYGWTSNNSVYCELGMNYEEICERVRTNGEPGFFWLKNAQDYGVMGSPPDYKDVKSRGGNPCLEQTLEPYELCCLVETFPNNHKDLEDYKETLEMAYLYAKTVTLGRTHWPESNRVMLRNRRIGCSMSGIAQFISKRGLNELKIWSEEGYKAIREHDVRFSDYFATPRSIKVTSVKPSGTVSLLAGATPGMHYPESRFCIRRVRISKASPLIPNLLLAGYHIEDCVGDEVRTAVVDFPVDMGENVRSLDKLSMWEQLSLAAFLQRYWSDNQVSSTITFDPKTEGPHIAHALQYFQYQLKGVSFLPRLPSGAYPQMPYEAITEEQYNALVAQIDRSVNLSTIPIGDHIPDKYCDSASCLV